MQIKGKKELNWLYNLYFSKFTKKKVVGTIPDIAEDISQIDDKSDRKIKHNSYTLQFVRNFVNLKIIEELGKLEFKGREIGRAHV